jgi:hypothetical protein
MWHLHYIFTIFTRTHCYYTYGDWHYYIITCYDTLKKMLLNHHTPQFQSKSNTIREGGGVRLSVIFITQIEIAVLFNLKRWGGERF